MIVVHLDRVSVTYISEPIFEDLSWEIHDERVVGLVGPNGCGKSTLLRLITGELSSDTGFTNRNRGLSIGYLPQEPQFEPGRSVWQEVSSASTELACVERELSRVEGRLADPAVYGDEKALTRALNRQARLLDEYTQLGGPSYEGRVRSTLNSLGFDEADMHLPVDVLSGGQKKLVGLARLLVTQPDMLLLDEPDNHLDLRGKAFLERFIRSYKGAVIIVSHDRYLLDMVVDEIVELEDGRLTRYPGNYSEYAFEKQTRLLRQQQMFQAQQKEITRLEQAAKRLLLWGKMYDNEKFSRRGKNILKRLDKMERIEKPVLDRRRMGLELNGWRGSNMVLEITDLDKVFPPSEANDDETIILAGLNLLLWRGERVGLVGPNGAGKSLLYRLILGQEPPTGGEIKIGPSVEVGYYAQEHDILDYGRTLLDTVRLAAKLSEDGAVSFLGRFLFTYEQTRSQVRTLSGGERVGLVGPNGAGKSLLYRLILGQEPPTGGEIKIGPSVEVGYYAQEHDILDYGRTLLDTVRLAAKLSEDGAVSFLGRFLFTYEQARSQVRTLSGGERSRLQMALLMLSDANFLLLDEPTNNLDIPSAEVLEAALEEFEGTVLVISHDRYFLDRVVDRIVELDEGVLTEYLGGYSDYQAAKAGK
jgi:ATP-binding cassette subfamily F protein 3